MRDPLIYVINLNRRKDRLERISLDLSSLKADFIRVEAVDGQEIIIGGSSPILRGGEVACWLSHLKVMRTFLESGAEFALVLEDDADLSRFAVENIQDGIASMSELSVDVLQLGWIDHIYRLPSTRGILDFVAAMRSRRIKSSKIAGLQVVCGEFRAGSHAYLINRKAAVALLDTNLPVMLAVDEYLGALAKNSFGHEKLQIGRTRQSQIGQISRGNVGSKIDSDV